MTERKKDEKAVTPVDVQPVTLEGLRHQAASRNALSEGIAPSAANSLRSITNALSEGVAPSAANSLRSITNALSEGIAPSAANSLRSVASPNTFFSPTVSQSDVSVISTADLGRLIRTARQGMRLSQQQFADLAGVGRRFVSELENGKATLEFGLVLQVCRAAGIDINAKRRQNR